MVDLFAKQRTLLFVLVEDFVLELWVINQQRVTTNIIYTEGERINESIYTNHNKMY